MTSQHPSSSCPSSCTATICHLLLFQEKTVNSGLIDLITLFCYWCWSKCVPRKGLCASKQFLGSCQAEHTVRYEHTAHFSVENLFWLPWRALLNHHSWNWELLLLLVPHHSRVCWLNLSASASHYNHGHPLQRSRCYPATINNLSWPPSLAISGMSLSPVPALHAQLVRMGGGELHMETMKLLRKQSSHKTVPTDESHLVFNSFWTNSRLPK